MGEGAKEPPFAVHPQVTRSPDRWGAHVARKDRILGSKLIEDASHILRMDGGLIGFICRQVIKALAHPPIVVLRGPQMLFAGVLLQFWQQGL